MGLRLEMAARVFTMSAAFSDIQVILLAVLALAQLIVFGLLQWRALGLAARPTAPQPSPPQPVPIPTLPPPIPAAPPAALPLPPAKPSGPFAGSPPWFQAALHEIGFHETGNNQGIERYIGMAHAGSLGDPWCAIFANAMLESCGIPGSRSASSQSFRNHPEFVQLVTPALGAVAVFWRGAKDSGFGHVGFYRGEDATRVWVLGGNENDMVQIEALPKSSATFGLIGYWWPKSVPLPSSGTVLMPTGSPTSVQAPPTGVAQTPSVGGLQTNIVATYFGGPTSAYPPNAPIDDNALGVALPFHFTGERPKVRVTGKKNGASVVCDIVDVGPWNTNDPYWQTGTRPQAETGTDTRGRHTNSAGIDLTLAAAKAVGIDGKGLVDWEFITAAAPAPAPTVT
jgi:uncharacterized protein (TIGR02594 family)